MGKRTRSVVDDYEYIAKKVKKLNKRLMRAKRKSRRRTPSSSSGSDSSSTSSSTGSSRISSRSLSPGMSSRPQPSPTLRDVLSIEDTPIHASEGIATMPSTGACAPVDAVPSTSAAAAAALAPAPSTSAAVEPQSSASVNTDILNDDILKILGDDPSQQKLYGNDIQCDLAIRLQHVATSGLTKEARKELMDKYLPPANCPLIDAPVLNPEVKAAIPESIYKRDKAIEQKQKQLSCVLSCLAETMTSIMTTTDNATIVQSLMNASKLLCDLQHSDSVTRRNFVLNNIKKEVKDQLQTTKIDKLLFSEELHETLKAAKAISKSSADMKLSNTKNAVKKSSKPAKNWRAPPPNRGRQKGNQRTREPAHTSHLGNSSKPSSAPARNRRR